MGHVYTPNTIKGVGQWPWFRVDYKSQQRRRDEVLLLGTLLAVCYDNQRKQSLSAMGEES